MRSDQWWEARRERLVKNEEAFRKYNNRRMNAEPVAADDDDEPIPFLCECGDFGCIASIVVTAAEFTESHSAPNRFIVLPGHVFADVERVVAQRDGYEVVEKLDMDVDAMWQAMVDG